MENTGIATYIERIEIEGLWGRFDVDWKLNPDVNVLIGKNGTGKTTILYLTSILARFSKGDVNEFNDIPANRFNKKMTAYFNKGLKATGLLDGRKYIIRGQFPLDYYAVKTFDTPLLSRDEFEKENKPGIITTLDKELENLINKYVDYQLNQSQKALRKEKSIEQAFAKRTFFIEKLNELFEETGKLVDENQNRISFIIDGKPISPYYLSSGEKQLLIMLLTVLTQDEKPSVLLLDEPESSLHLDWQYELINILRTLNPNCQLIIVTHSPSIFTDGHKPKVFWIEDILHPTKQALEVAQ